MLLIDTTALQVAQIAITSFVGVFGIASALEGYCVSNMNIVIRVLMAVGGLLLIHPAFITDVIGFVIVGVCMVIQYMIAKKVVVAS